MDFRKKEFKHYELMVYRIDNTYILNLIYIYENKQRNFYSRFKRWFIEGLLKKKKIKKLINYEFERNKKLNLTLNTSLVKTMLFIYYLELLRG